MILPLDSIRANLLQQAQTVIMNRSAAKIQKWIKSIQLKRRVIEKNKQIKRALIKITKVIFLWKKNVRDPRIKREYEQK